MYEVLDSGSLEFFGAGGIAGNHKLGATVEILECLGSKSGLFVV